MAIYQHFSTDALFRFKMDFGFMYPDYEVEFRANDEAGMDPSMFEGYQVKSTEYSIESVELTEAGALIRAKLKQVYSWSGSEGTMTAQETLTVGNIEGVHLITEMESLQEYK